MVMYSINELCIGLKVIQNGEPCVVIANECVKPGKGQSFNRVSFRQIISGKILEKTCKSGDYVKSADVVELSLMYVYNDRECWYFMDKNFEQISIPMSVIGNNIKWMIEQLYYVVTLWNSIPILIFPPNFVELKIVHTMEVVKSTGSTIASGTKLATLSTGAIIKVPVFMQLGDLIKVNTSTGMYVSRIIKQHNRK